MFSDRDWSCFCQLYLWSWPLTLSIKFLLNLGTSVHYCPCHGQPSYQFWCFWDFSLSTYGPTHVIRITWHCDHDLWPWRSRKLSQMAFHLHLFQSCVFCWDKPELFKSSLTASNVFLRHPLFLVPSNSIVVEWCQQ